MKEKDKQKKTIKEILADWNTIAPEYRTQEKLVELTLSQQKQEIIKKIKKISFTIYDGEMKREVVGVEDILKLLTNK